MLGGETRTENTCEGGSHAGGDEVMTRALVDTIESGALPLAGVWEGISAAATAFAIDQANDRGSVVAVDAAIIH